MIDITTNPKDKDNFILRVYLKDDIPSYFVQYASGRIEEFELTLHNLNAALLRMEEQFREYKDEYLKRIAEIRFKANLSKLIEAFVALGAIFLTTAMPFPPALKIIIDAIIAVLSIYYQKVEGIKVGVCNSSESVVFTAEEFLKNKEMFLTKVIDPKTRQVEDWYLVSLSEIESFSSPQQLDLIGKALTSEVKQEESERTTKALRKIMNREMSPTC